MPQDIYQTAKVSKILLAINSGKGHQYKGKTLDEIDVSDSFDIQSDDEKDLCGDNYPKSSPEVRHVAPSLDEQPNGKAVQVV